MILGLIHLGFQKWVLVFSYRLKVAPRVRARLTGASVVVGRASTRLAPLSSPMITNACVGLTVILAGGAAQARA